MSDNVLTELVSVIKERKENKEEGSYTCYLFEKGTDKILKKVGEECAETIIAAKNFMSNQGSAEDLTGEVSDLIYHLLVMLEDTGIPFDSVLHELETRSLKTGNKKVMKNVDKNS